MLEDEITVAGLWINNSVAIEAEFIAELIKNCEVEDIEITFFEIMLDGWVAKAVIDSAIVIATKTTAIAIFLLEVKNVTNRDIVVVVDWIGFYTARRVIKNDYPKTSKEYQEKLYELNLKKTSMTRETLEIYLTVEKQFDLVDRLTEIFQSLNSAEKNAILRYPIVNSL